ncbi:MAG: hypothetical protein C0501_06285 [Isosphaera sp.]|nr:hypothetical protein [Isosphaera sp.]
MGEPGASATGSDADVGPRPLAWAEGGRAFGPQEAPKGRAPSAQANGLGPTSARPGSPPVSRLRLRDGSAVESDWYVLAVSFDRVADLLPDELARDPYFAKVGNLAASPITSVHLWYDRPVLPVPHAVLVDCVGQWVFGRGEVAPGEHYVQVVVSASRGLRELGRDEVRRRVADELGRVFPAAGRAAVLRSKVVTEHAATFSAVPGVDRWRPAQASPVPNLVLAGDWTATGWPATMEGAVRSGYLAAEAVLARAGRPERLVRPDLS